MKKLITLITGSLLVVSALAQAPDFFHYQALLREPDGSPMANREVAIRVDLIRDQVDNPSIYLENHEVTTNDLGIVNLKIGDSDFFKEIDWGEGPYFLSITVNGIHVGTSQLMSVPYALYAEKTGNVNDDDHDPTNEIQTLSLEESTRELSISLGNSVVLPLSPWREIEQDIYFLRNVGIGLLARPGYPLDIRKAVYGQHDQPLVRLRNTDQATIAYTGIAFETIGDGDKPTSSWMRSEFLQTSDNYDVIPSFRGMTAIRAAGSGFSILADSVAGSIRFYTTPLTGTIVEQARFEPGGNLGLGTTDPEARIHVKEGDIFVEDPDRGIILTAPGGKRYRVTVDNDGNLQGTEVVLK